MLPTGLKRRFQNRSDLGTWTEHAEALKWHKSNRISSVPAFIDDGQLPAGLHLGTLLKLLAQATNERCIDLHEGALTGACYGTSSSLASAVRAHIETTALLGYLVSRCHSQMNKNIVFEDLHMIAARAVLGSRLDDWRKRREEDAREHVGALNVMTLLAHADKYIHNILEYGEVEDDAKILSESHEWVSEFTHPNFLALTLHYDLDKTAGHFRIGKARKRLKPAAGLLSHLLISHALFADLFDGLSNHIERSDAD